MFRSEVLDDLDFFTVLVLDHDGRDSVVGLDGAARVARGRRFAAVFLMGRFSFFLFFDFLLFSQSRRLNEKKRDKVTLCSYVRIHKHIAINCKVNR